MKNKTLKNIYDRKNNSFGLLSMIMAIMIIYYHCYYLFYGPSPDNLDFFSNLFVSEDTGGIVVAMFFIISGFMIATSIKNSKNIKSFLLKRVKRIFPPLILVVAVCTFVVAPVLSELPKEKFIVQPNLYINYFLDNILIIKNSNYGIPTVLLDNPYPYTINGSLWTIKHQFFMYLYIIPLFLVFFKREDKNRKNDFMFFFLILFVVNCLSYAGYLDFLFDFNMRTLGKYIGILYESKKLIRLLYYFTSGVFINLFSDKIKCDRKSVLLMIIILLLTMRTNLFHYSMMILLPYFTILIGSSKSKIKIKDISYYIYLVGFPIQQIIMHYLKGNINFITYIIISIILSYIIGYCLYYIIEILPIHIKNIYNYKKNKLNVC